jgi:hypothetical protein
MVRRACLAGGKRIHLQDFKMSSVREDNERNVGIEDSSEHKLRRLRIAIYVLAALTVIASGTIYAGVSRRLSLGGWAYLLGYGGFSWYSHGNVFDVP